MMELLKLKLARLGHTGFILGMGRIGREWFLNFRLLRRMPSNGRVWSSVMVLGETMQKIHTLPVKVKAPIAVIRREC